jgi:2-oxoglutarate dehydrogenase E2 component (dihydrolipoamide succinyltransferase)
MEYAMSGDIIVPPLGESVSEAFVSKWFKKIGEAVKEGEPLVELESDKVTLEVPAPASGVLATITVNEGSSVEVGAQLGSITVGAAASATPAAAAPQPGPSVAAPTATPSAAPAPASTPVEPKAGELLASPAAKKIMAENELAASQVEATGKGGRITKEDVINTLEKSSAQAATTAATAPAAVSVAAGERAEQRVRMSGLRKSIAARLKESQNTAAILTTFNEVDMTNAIALRNEYKDVFEKKHGVKLGFMSFFVKAAVHALKEFPDVNAEISGGDIIYKHYYDVGVAVGTEQGLVVPVVRNADRLSFADIEKEIGRLAKRARDGQLTVAEMTGGTFTITNGGVYGSLMSTPIINPPQSGILGMHKTQDRPVAVNGKVEIRPMMYIALSYDHRIIDGKVSVSFLVKIKEAMEDPRRLLLDL